MKIEKRLRIDQVDPGDSQVATEPTIRVQADSESHSRRDVSGEALHHPGAGRNVGNRQGDRPAPVKDEPDVLKIRNGQKSAHTRYSIPESVAKKIYLRLQNAA